MTTTNLRTPRHHWFDLPVPAAAGITVFCLFLIAGLIGQLRSAPSVQAQPTPALQVQTAPIIVIQKETLPTAPPLPTATPEVIYVEVPAAPQVIYVEVPAQPVYIEVPALAVPTPAPEEYAVANQPPASDFYAPPDTSIEERQKLIGSDPNALACNGSPLCGGLTNAQAQAALDAEQRRASIQNRLANEHQPAQPVPAATQTLDAALATIEIAVAGGTSEAWRQEHCIGSGDSEVCR